MTNDFIFELGCEELPSSAVWSLTNEFANHILSALDKAELSYGEVKRYATPRRLALVIHDLQDKQKNQSTVRRGPALTASFDSEGMPSKALIGFASSCGVDVNQLTQLQTDKGDWMVYESETFGKKTRELMPELVSQSLAALPIPKPMRWGSGDVEFSRPVHWAVMLYGNEVLEHEILGVKSGRNSRGHRFHHPQEVVINSVSTYESQMTEAFVIPDFSLRRQMIKEQVNALADSIHAEAVMPDELLDEVTSIVEWPQALLAHYEEVFLEVPSEALIASMQAHQKCFALKDKQGRLIPNFITVANISSAHPEQVVLGNEKVMRARLSDAAFFFNQDKKQSLSDHIASTEQVVFQVKLGSLQDKVLRVKALMPHLVQALNLDKKQAERAVSLSKCDLMTGMVGEFPELQGLMGYYYALHDGEDKAVAQALNEQYMPRFSGDTLPTSDLGLALSLADRLDTLVGIFAIGQKPSGVKDPFKLRRHALAVVRLLTNTASALNLSTLIDEVLLNYGERIKGDKILVTELKPFILDRLNAYYQSQGVSTDLIHAVRARQDEWLYDMDKRLNALKHFVSMPEASSLSAACKRVNNLLNHAAPSTDNKHEVKEQLLEVQEERALYIQINEISRLVEPLYRGGDYVALLQQLASLREPVDLFFDKVMVMVDDEALKTNRLALLSRLQLLLQGVADISMLQI